MEQTKIDDYKSFSVFKLSIPIFFQMLLSMCLGYTDTIMLSHFDENAVGAIGNANHLTGFLMLAFSIISSSTGVIVAQYLGAKRKHQMNQIYTLAIFFNLVLSVFVSAVIFLFARPLLTAMKVPGMMLEDSTSYIKITGMFLFCQAIIGIFQQIFVCNGKTNLCMFLSMGISILNIIGNWCFLYGPLKFLNFAVKGVALSTSLSQICGTVFCIIVFYKVIGGRIDLKSLNPFPVNLLKKLIQLGIPTAGENISYTISQIIITTIINTMGEVSITAKVYCSTLSLLAMTFSNAAGGATAIVIGHATGAGDEDYAYRKVLQSTRNAMIASFIIAGLNALLSRFTLTLFSKNPEIIEIGKSVMIVAFFLELGRCLNIVIIRSLRAAGDVLFPTVLGMVSMWGISVVFSFVLGKIFNLGLTGVWIAMAMDEIIRGIIVLIRWIKGSWRGKSIVSR